MDFFSDVKYLLIFLDHKIASNFFGKTQAKRKPKTSLFATNTAAWLHGHYRCIASLPNHSNENPARSHYTPVLTAEKWDGDSD